MPATYYHLPLDLEGILERRQLPRCSMQDSVAQHIYLLLTSYFGESRYDADFGCQVWEQDFEAMANMRWKDRVQQSVEQAIGEFEPRLTKVRAQVAVIDFELKGVSQRIRRRLEIAVTAELHRTREPFTFHASMFVAPLSVD